MCIVLELQLHYLQKSIQGQRKAGKKLRSKDMIEWLKEALIKVLNISS